MNRIIDFIDESVAIEMMKAAVASKPDGYKYEKTSGNPCRYVDFSEAYNPDEHLFEMVSDSERPGCLIGTALILAGIPIDVFLRDEVNEEDSNEVLSHLFTEGYIGRVGGGAARLMYNVQNRQDSGEVWSDALDNSISNEDGKNVV